MGTTLHTLKGPRGATRNRKRIGRGPGSGTGEQSGKGVKGQKARTGHHGARFGFEGGQMPMQRRFPKKGFKNPFRKEVFAVNVGALEKRFPAGTVDLAALQGAGMVPAPHKTVKILGEGDLKKKFVVKATAFSASAKGEDREGGGTAEVVST
jgi:large subunit ribosomal protein L15